MQSTSRTVGEWESSFSPLQWRPWEAGVRTLWSSSVPSVTISPPGLASLRGKYLTIFSRDYSVGLQCPDVAGSFPNPSIPGGWFGVGDFYFPLSLFFVFTPFFTPIYCLSSFSLPPLPITTTIIIIIIIIVGSDYRYLKCQCNNNNDNNNNNNNNNTLVPYCQKNNGAPFTTTHALDCRKGGTSSS